MGRSYGEGEGAGTGPVGITEDTGWDPGWPAEAYAENAARSLLERQPLQPPWARAELWSGGEAVASHTETTYQRLRALPGRVRRALQRRFPLSLAELAVLLALWQGPGLAATINVTGGCKLIDAITAANTDNTAGRCSAGSGADTIVLASGSGHTLTKVDNTTAHGPNGLPVVTSVITIEGKGRTVRRSGATNFRLLEVGSGGNLTIQDLTLQGGNPGGAFQGGAVFNGSTLTLINSTLSGNTARFGGGVYNPSGAHLALIHTTVSGNTAIGSGAQAGGVDNFGGTAILTMSTVSSNSAAGQGGGIFNNAALTVSNSTISGNTGSEGGGIFNTGSDGSVTLTNSTISGNSASQHGGGLRNTTNGTLTVTNSTISANTATSYGAGVFSTATTTLTNSTITSNTSTASPFDTGAVDCSAGSLTLVQTLVSGNITNAGGPQVYRDGTICDTLTVNDYNIFGQSGVPGIQNFSAGITDITPTGALASFLNSTLAFNGGPTETHALVGGGEAVNRVSAANCAQDTDQRGFIRPSGDDCDIGAVEAGASEPPVVNSRVSFVALPSTFSTTTETTGCPSGFTGGKFSFQAQLTNLAGSPALLALKDQVVELANDNLVLTADGGEAAGEASLQTLPQVEDFNDGVLQPTGTVMVPFVICLTDLTPFRFTVDVLGGELGP